MVLIFKSLVDLWRERLAAIDATLRSGERESWRLQFERRILSYLVRRFGTEDRSPPAQARPLEPEDHKRSEQLKLSAEAMERLGIEPAEKDAWLLEEEEGKTVPYELDKQRGGLTEDMVVLLLLMLAIGALIIVCVLATH